MEQIAQARDRHHCASQKVWRELKANKRKIQWSTYSLGENINRIYYRYICIHYIDLDIDNMVIKRYRYIEL